MPFFGDVCSTYNQGLACMSSITMNPVGRYPANHLKDNHQMFNYKYDDVLRTMDTCRENQLFDFVNKEGNALWV